VPGDLLLDPFAGSDTTLVAAVSTGLPALGIAEYTEIAAKRLVTFAPVSQDPEGTGPESAASTAA
jgi:DNA modification methylase